MCEKKNFIFTISALDWNMRLVLDERFYILTRFKPQGKEREHVFKHKNLLYTLSLL